MTHGLSNDAIDNSTFFFISSFFRSCGGANNVSAYFFRNKTRRKKISNFQGFHQFIDSFKCSLISSKKWIKKRKNISTTRKRINEKREKKSELSSPFCSLVVSLISNQRLFSLRCTLWVDALVLTIC